MSHGTSIGVKGRIFRAVENATRGLIYAGMVKPVPTAFVPAYGYEGMRYRGTITGTNLGTVTAVSLGTNITVESFTIDSNTQISVVFRTDADASAGMRDLTCYRGAVFGVLVDAFDLRLSDAIVLPSKKPAKQRMEKLLEARAYAQYAHETDVLASVKVQHVGFNFLAGQMKVAQPISAPLPGQAIVQVRTSKPVSGQVHIQKMADIASGALVLDKTNVELVSDRHVEMVEDVRLSMDEVSATLVDERLEES